MKINYNKDFECYMVAECHKTNVIELDGVQLIPMTELEKIKAEIEGLAFDYIDFSADKELVVDLDNIEEVFDKHISELKGETK